MSNPTIFIVDDDEAVRDSLKLLLESYGMEVRDYPSTADFARDYHRNSKECLILDQHLIGSTGLEFLASAEGAKLRLPVILITGQGDASTRERARQLGVLAHLEKPVPDGVLMAAVNQALDGKGR